MDVIKHIQLADRDAFELLLVLSNCVHLTDEAIQQAEKKTVAEDPDLIESLNAYATLKSDAKKLLKNLQKQTGDFLYEDQIIDEM